MTPPSPPSPGRRGGELLPLACPAAGGHRHDGGRAGHGGADSPRTDSCTLHTVSQLHAPHGVQVRGWSFTAGSLPVRVAERMTAACRCCKSHLLCHFLDPNCGVFYTCRSHLTGADCSALQGVSVDIQTYRWTRVQSVWTRPLCFQSRPVQSSPVQSSPVQSSPVQASPVQASPGQARPGQSSPDQNSAG